MRVDPACHQVLSPLRHRAVAGALLAATLAVVAMPASAINRCEGRDGRITYTDEPCPSTARNTRRVDDSPPVQVRDATARDARPDAKADAKADAKTDAKTDAKAEPAKDAKDAGSGRLQPGRIVASTNPEQEMQRLDEQRARQQRQCADLNRRIDYARSDLQGSIGGDRASAELALRRLQEEAKLVCPAR